MPSPATMIHMPHSSPSLRSISHSTYQPVKQSTKPSSPQLISQPSHQLKRVLRWPDLLMLGIGCTIGSGIFVVTGEVAAKIAGPSVCISYIIAALCSLCASLCYAEFASMYTDTSGSAYHYTKSAMGYQMGWLIGWDLLLEYAVSGAAVAKGWSKHAQQLMSILDLPLLPTKFMNAPISESFQISDNLIDLPAVLITCLLTCLLLRGLHSSTWLNTVMVMIKLSVVLFVLVVGLPHVDWSHFTPFMPYGFSSITLFGHTFVGESVNGESVGVVAGASIVFFAYVGFDSVSTCARECVEPARDLPIGLIGSLLVSTTLYVGVSIVLVGMVPYQLIDTGAPFSQAFASIGMPWASTFISIGACTGITSVLLVTMLGQPRLLMAMAKDRLLPNVFNHVSSRGTPDYGASITCLCICLMAGMFPMSVLVEMVSIGTLFAFVTVCICVLVYRQTHPHLHRPFRCPWSPFIPLAGIIMCLYLMLSLPLTNWIRLIGWLIVGLIVFFAYGRRRYLDNEYQLTKQDEINQSNNQVLDLLSEDDDHDDIDVNDLIDHWSEDEVDSSIDQSIHSNSDDDVLGVSNMNER